MQAWKVVAASVLIGSAGFAARAQEAPADKKPPAGEPERRPRPAGERPAGERQPGERPGGARGGAQLSPEKAKAAWEVQARGVAVRHGAKPEQIGAVVTAYAAARESQAAGFAKLRDEFVGGGGGGGAAEMMQAVEEMNAKEREKLEKALTSAVSAEFAGKAIASLGVFARNWDAMADTIAGFKLGADKHQQALDTVETFVIDLSKSRGADREQMREIIAAANKKATDAMKTILSEEQFKQFEQSMRAGFGPGGRRPGAGEGGGRGGRPGGGGGEGGGG